MSEIIDTERFAIRAILLTPEREVLLLRILPDDNIEPFWIAPGGGQESGETFEETLRRELREELGLTEFAVGPVVWRREHTFRWAGRRIRQQEQYHIVHVPRFQPVMTDETEAKSLDRFQWWPAADLAQTRERLTPLSLATIVEQYMANGAPREPLALEVLVD
ncbi:DNA mismatch repair protein MutT [Capsulimonas corticalis]|uniref:DNA mismatch repair protein MutT n=1 Tax=Capsulimonas corticalis TaxID=2219043 RepID=A0A402D0A5_9BACT|nr:NUDIX domain-containing protein [Capsulimonas corticalis]BDI33725.1 DNA mismatch repair protein MutT [Capsulimonas corticalis]